MNIHSSVSLCKRCDLYVAEDLINTCDYTFCHEHYCPECRVNSVEDRDMVCCSQRCAALLDWQLRREDNATASRLGA